MAIELELIKYLEEEEVDMRTLRTSSYRLPNHRTIEVGESHILVELPAVPSILQAVPSSCGLGSSPTSILIIVAIRQPLKVIVVGWVKFPTATYNITYDCS